MGVGVALAARVVAYVVLVDYILAFALVPDDADVVGWPNNESKRLHLLLTVFAFHGSLR